MNQYLTTRELAELLRIKERKVYDLAASGEVPCSRAMGKLLFPREAVEAWLAANSSGPQEARARPAVFLGSHDPLLEWALRQSRCGFAAMFEASVDGLDLFAAGEGCVSGLHLYSFEAKEWNRPFIVDRFAGEPVVLVEWAWRQRGLILGAGNPKGITGIADLKGATVVHRQREAGSQQLFDRLLAEAGLSPAALNATAIARSESDAALTVHERKADAAFGLESLARQYRLDFVPVIAERFDLLVWRRDWFEPPFQSLFKFCRSEAFVTRAGDLGGYDISGLGTVHFNGP